MNLQLVLVRISQCPLVLPTPERIFAPLDGSKLVIGRNEQADVQLRASDSNGTMLISRQHAEIRMDPETKSLHILDLGGINGTYVNGKRVLKNVEKRLRRGDVVSFGNDPGNNKGEFLYQVQEQPLSTYKDKEPVISATESRALEARIQTLARELVEEKQRSRVAEAALANEETKAQEAMESIAKLRDLYNQAKTEGEEKADAISKKFFDFQEKFRERLECPICFETRTTGNLLLRCGHVVCEPCMKDWKKKSNTCPTCSEKMKEPITRAYILDEFVSLLNATSPAAGKDEGESREAAQSKPNQSKKLHSLSTSSTKPLPVESASSKWKKPRTGGEESLANIVDLT